MTGSRRNKKNQLKLVHCKAEIEAEIEPEEAEVEADEDVWDRISDFGDDILLCIISRLTWKEATATRLLSTRWATLHTRIPQLNFPPLVDKDFEYKFEHKDVEEVKKKHIKMINRTLDSYKGGRMLKEFTVDAHCVKGANVMRWLDFALAREVEVIEIRLSSLAKEDCGHYCLQLEKLISRRTLPGLKCLRELSLSTVGVDDGDFTLLLSNSPNLESLSLEYPRMLRNISMVGHPKLQHFNICSPNVQSIEIKDLIKLVSLSWYTLPRTCVVQVNNVPQLNEFSSDNLQRLFGLPPCVLSQLQLVRFKGSPMLPDWFFTTELINVKRLEVEVYDPQGQRPFFALIEVIEECRSLEEFEMKVVRLNSKKRYVSDYFYGYRAGRECSPNLKTVKLSGFLDIKIEWKFAAFIIKYAAVPLQEIVVELCHDSKSHRNIATSNVLNQLKPIIPNTVNLVVI